jgi:hypothetical protein
MARERWKVDAHNGSSVDRGFSPAVRQSCLPSSWWLSSNAPVPWHSSDDAQNPVSTGTRSSYSFLAGNAIT